MPVRKEYCFRLLELKGVRIPLTLAGIRNRILVEYRIKEREVEVLVFIKPSWLQRKAGYLSTFTRVGEFFRQNDVPLERVRRSSKKRGRDPSG